MPRRHGLTLTLTLSLIIQDCLGVTAVLADADQNGDTVRPSSTPLRDSLGGGAPRNVDWSAVAGVVAVGVCMGRQEAGGGSAVAVLAGDVERRLARVVAVSRVRFGRKKQLDNLSDA